MPDPSILKRVAFSPGEFAELFGKSQTWGYRQIYAGKVTAITEHGRILIPAKEVERILEKAGIYDGKQKPKKKKADFKKLTSAEQSTWQKFVMNRRNPKAEEQRVDSSRQSVHARVANSWRGRSR